jgi:HD-like signal output (HDOD) protein
MKIAMSSSENMRDAVNHLNALPAIPLIAQKILSLKLISDEGEVALLKLVEQDPLLSAKVIGLSNAPMFGAMHKIMSVRDAAAVLGIKRVKMIALSFAMMSSMAQRHTGSLDVKHLWQHSLIVAMAMHTLALGMLEERRPPDDDIFLAGLLHDIGFLVLNYIDPSLSDTFQTRLARENNRPMEEIEAEMLDMSHSELGAELGQYWNLPASIVSVLRNHHYSPDAEIVKGEPLVMLACMAEKLLPTFVVNEHIHQVVSDQEWQALGIDASKIEEIKELVEKHNREVLATFN